MKKLFITAVILSFLISKIGFSQSLLLTPNQMNSKQSSLIDNIILQGTNPPNIVGIRYNGTLAVPTATPADSWLISMEGKGHTGTGISNTRSAIRFITTQAWTSIANGTKTDFYTTPNGSTILTHRMVINEDGKIGIGTGPTQPPTARLQITHDGGDTDPHIRLHTTGANSRITWSTNTNANIWTAQSYLENATATNNYWALEYGGASRFIIKGDGKFGIGTISPDTKLHLIGNENDGTDASLKITSGAQNMLFDGNEIDALAADLYLNNNSNLNVILAQGGGNVGIGTNIPSSKLHLVGNENDGTAASLKITSGAQSMLFDGNEIDALSTGLYLNNNTNLNVILAQGGGNVGIGTTTPNNKLDVLGVIRANEVIVETGWADYVFKEDYQLKPLDEVEAFIKENKHLPAIPSAANIQDKGAHVAELMTKMMEKIEELTLYTIQQKKEIDALKKRLDDKK
ncbi:hypothetical protein [Emticicia sp. SJ17W-69]|uniref:hypothetical protein n=1 Tax=Emticicia sp. SJ17W-69 TaxID=3421657 RepID=UPI003EBF0C8B